MLKITAFAWFDALRRFEKYLKKYLNTHISQSIKIVFKILDLY